MKRVITGETVAKEKKAGRTRIPAPRGQAVITPSAWAKARELGVSLDRAAPADESAVREKSARARPPKAGGGAALERPREEAGTCARVVDASGLVVVRGKSVRLGRFAGAGEERDVRLTDVVTGRDRSPMTAGFMSWRRDDSFPWTLDYDEVDHVLDGVLQITIDGRPTRLAASSWPR